jgi:DNA-binding NtrC family response regulator
MKKNVKILHIDDEDTYLDIIQILLEKYKLFNIKVDKLNDPQKLDTKLFYNKYDVIICDYIMKPLNGLDVLTYLRGIGIQIPFILLTGRLKNAKIIRKINSYTNTRYMLKNLDLRIMTNKLVFTINSLLEFKKK